MNGPPLKNLAARSTPVPGHRPALDLEIELGADGRSRLAARQVSFPWSLGRGYPGPPGDPVKLIPQVAGAGLLAGDHVTQRIKVARDAALHLVSAGAMLTYGTPGAAPSISDWQIDLDDGASAFLVSEPYVLLNDAALTLNQSITVAANATLIGCEGIVLAQPSNRSRWQTETIVRRPDGSIVFIDRQLAGTDALSRQSELARAWSAFGTVMVLAPPDKISIQAIVQHAESLASDVWIAVSITRDNSGICARIAAKNGQHLRDVMHSVVAAAISLDALSDG